MDHELTQMSISVVMWLIPRSTQKKRRATKHNILHGNNFVFTSNETRSLVKLLLLLPGELEVSPKSHCSLGKKNLVMRNFCPSLVTHLIKSKTLEALAQPRVGRVTWQCSVQKTLAEDLTVMPSRTTSLTSKQGSEFTDANLPTHSCF